MTADWIGGAQQRQGVVVILIDFGETWTISDPMPRYVAEHVLADFAHGVAWVDGRHPTGALLVPTYR